MHDPSIVVSQPIDRYRAMQSADLQMRTADPPSESRSKMRDWNFLQELNKSAAALPIGPAVPGKSIEKIIHQTYYSRTLPPEIVENIELIKKLNPGWEHRLYFDEDILKFIQGNYGPDMLRVYQKLSPRYGAAKADFFRYLLIYKVGGVYLDIKSTIDCAFDDVLKPDDQFILSYWNNKAGEKHATWGLHHDYPELTEGEFQQWHVIAARGHPFLKAVIENVYANINRYIPAVHATGKDGVLRVTGPIAYTLAIKPLLPLHPHRMIDSERDLGLEYSIYSGVTHKGVFKSHYATQKTSIVKIGLGKSLFSGLWATWQVAEKVWRRLFH